MTPNPNVKIADINFDELKAGELTSSQLEGVSGGRTNADDPLYQIFLTSAKAAFYQGMYYSTQGW